MGLGSYYVTSPRICFSTEDYNEWMNEHYSKNNDDDDEKIIPKWFFYLIAMIVKHIERLQIIYVLTIDHIDF